MSIEWLMPAALWGLVGLAVPVLVHLLTRQERTAIPFPTLRFLVATRLVSMRHRRIHDWWLLLTRAAILAAAVGALAAPLLITARRQEGWNTRTARAIVVVGSRSGEVATPSAPSAPSALVPAIQPFADESESAFVSRVFGPYGRIADAITAGVEWLNTQPPAARELLIVGDLREGGIASADLSSVPAQFGIRFLPDTTPPSQVDVSIPVQTDDRGRETIDMRRVRLAADDTIIERTAGEQRPAGENGRRLEVRATGDEQRVADAALAALLTDGIIVDAEDGRRVVVSWTGDTPEPMATPGGAVPQRLAPWMIAVVERVGLTGDLDGDALVVKVPGRPDGALAVNLLRDIASAAFDTPDLPPEPTRVSAGDLVRWSRPPGAAPADAVRQDEGDRRWLWALALALLAVEGVLRRSGAVAETTHAPVEASRVA